MLDDLKFEHNLTDDQVNEMFDNAWEYASNHDYNTGEVGEAITASLEESFKEWVSE